MAIPLARVRLRVIVPIAGFLPVLSGRSVGPSGLKGIFFQLVRAALPVGTVDDFCRMLSASQPQVRALGLVCLCLRQPANLKDLVAPLSSDESKVKIRPFGCVVTELTLAQLTQRLLRDPSAFGHRSLMRA
jgi:hypothetical protein